MNKTKIKRDNTRGEALKTKYFYGDLVQKDLKQDDSKAFSELCNKFHKEFESKRKRERNYWKHITLILATVISFFAIFFNQANVQPNNIIISALYLMVFGLLFGLLLIKESIYFINQQETKKAISKYNRRVINKWRKNGKITDLEKTGLSLANLYRDRLPDKSIIDKYPRVVELLKEGMKKLPSRTRFGKSKRNTLREFISKRFNLLINLFYVSTLMAFCLFLLGLLIKD